MSVGTMRNAVAAPSDSRAGASARLPWKLKVVLRFCLVPCQGTSAAFPGSCGICHGAKGHQQPSARAVSTSRALPSFSSQTSPARESVEVMPSDL